MNKSEKQLADFLKAKKDYSIYMSLIPQGDNTMIEKEAINLCEVEVYINLSRLVYRFGGISEKVYNKLVAKYDYRKIHLEV